MRVLILVLLVTLAFGGSQAVAEDSLLKSNAWYEIRAASKDVPLPFRATANADGGFYSTLNVLVIKHGSGEWYWVEFDRLANLENQKGPAAITKRRAWLNIGQATLILPAAGPDYKKAYPQGFQIVPAP